MESNISSVKGKIHSIESFGLVDGPGVRFVVFFQGCKMRCKFCHNPDTWVCEGADEVEYTASALMEKALRFRPYWKNNGGITVSGGEPLLQLDFLIEFFRLAKKEGIHTTIDTAGNPFTRDEPFFSKFNELMSYTDLILLDIKEIDNDKHKMITGFDNGNILDMARYLSDIGKPVWIRHVLTPGLSDFDEDIDDLSAFIDTLTNVERVEVLPYHTLGTFKWEKLGIDYSLKDTDPPSEDRVQNANLRLHTERYK